MNWLQWSPSKAATIGNKDFVCYKGVSLTQGSYKPHPLQWSLGSSWKLQYMDHKHVRLLTRLYGTCIIDFFSSYFLLRGCTPFSISPREVVREERSSELPLSDKLCKGEHTYKISKILTWLHIANPGYSPQLEGANQSAVQSGSKDQDPSPHCL